MSILSMILKYAGLLLATVSSVWGTLHDLTENKNGRRVLTRPGKIAMSFTALGFAVALGSNIVEDLSKSKEVQAEVRRTVAAQPLASLDFEWEFPMVSETIRGELKQGDKEIDDYVNDQQRDIDSDEMNELNRIYKLYGFLLSYAREMGGEKPKGHTTGGADLRHPALRLASPRGTRRAAPKAKESKTPSEKDSVLVLVSLDDGQNAILSFGTLRSPVTWSLEAGILSKRKNVLSGGVSTCPFPSQYCQFDDTPDAPRSINSWPALQDPNASMFNDRRVLTIVWTLNPLTLANSIDRQNTAINPTAQFPAKLKIAILYNIEDLPFRTPDFAFPEVYSLWSDPDKGKRTVEKPPLSNVKLIPNNLAESAYRYKLVQASTRPLFNSYDEETQSDCLLLEFAPVD
jgi:hypothetical protein